MKCPKDNTEMANLNSGHADGTGDVYYYCLCGYCKTEYEVIIDELHGGEPTVKEL